MNKGNRVVLMVKRIVLQQ